MHPHIALGAALGAALSLPSAMSAQCTPANLLDAGLTPTGFFANPSLNPGLGVYLDLDCTTPVTLQQLKLGLQAAPAQLGSVEVWIVDVTNGLNGGTVTANLPRTYTKNPTVRPAAPWNQAGPDAVGTLFAGGFNGSFTATLTPPLSLNAGRFGICLVLVPNGTTATTTAPAANALRPNLANLGIAASVSDLYLTLTTRGLNGTAFGTPTLNQFMPNLQVGYTLGASTAYATSFGVGCYGYPRSFYQSFVGPASTQGAAPSVTTAAPHLLMTPQGTPTVNYLVQAGTGIFPLVAPGSTNYFTLSSGGSTPTHVNTVAPAANLFGDWDDANSVLYTLPFPLSHPGGTSTQISICSNGVVYMDSTAGRMQFFDLYDQFLGGPAAFAVGFGDFWPGTGSNGVGEIFADSDGATFVAVSWVNMSEYPNNAFATAGSSFQVVFRSSGQVEYAWGNLRGSNGAPMLIGYSEGHTVRDPGVGQSAPRAAVGTPAASFVAAMPFVSGDGRLPPTLTATTRPRIGSPLLLGASNLDPTIQGVMLFLASSSVPGGVDLGSLLGMPGCSAYILGPTQLATNLSLGAPSSQFNLGVVPVLPPSDFIVQAACLSNSVPAVNGLNVLVSNGVCLHVDVN